ncbi:hypothetical protein ABPG75_006063 [Micractinium tetrahymenae]
MAAIFSLPDAVALGLSCCAVVGWPRHGSPFLQQPAAEAAPAGLQPPASRLLQLLQLVAASMRESREVITPSQAWSLHVALATLVHRLPVSEAAAVAAAAAPGAEAAVRSMAAAWQLLEAEAHEQQQGSKPLRVKSTASMGQKVLGVAGAMCCLASNAAAGSSGGSSQQDGDGLLGGLLLLLRSGGKLVHSVAAAATASLQRGMLQRQQGQEAEVDVEKNAGREAAKLSNSVKVGLSCSAALVADVALALHAWGGRCLEASDDAALARLRQQLAGATLAALAAVEGAAEAAQRVADATQAGSGAGSSASGRAVAKHAMAQQAEQAACPEEGQADEPAEPGKEGEQEPQQEAQREQPEQEAAFPGWVQERGGEPPAPALAAAAARAWLLAVLPEGVELAQARAAGIAAVQTLAELLQAASPHDPVRDCPRLLTCCLYGLEAAARRHRWLALEMCRSGPLSALCSFAAKRCHQPTRARAQFTEVLLAAGAIRLASTAAELLAGVPEDPPPVAATTAATAAGLAPGDAGLCEAAQAVQRELAAVLPPETTPPELLQMRCDQPWL